MLSFSILLFKKTGIFSVPPQILHKRYFALLWEAIMGVLSLTFLDNQPVS